MSEHASSIAVLSSGGLDSAILLAELASQHARVQPLYIRAGLHWEPSELVHLQKFLQALPRSSVQPLVVLDMPVADLYGRHWSLTGEHVPDGQSADDAVYLPGRNVLLLAKALLWCHLNNVPALALAPLKTNPFPDATDRFFMQLETAVNQAMSNAVAIRRPYAHLSKTEVLLRGKGLPLQWTFSCIRPVAGRHCGHCNKCAERQKGFADAAMQDPTEYATR